ncbi:Ubiquitin carboxyl-terminal hydrolase 35 [Mortierella sp. GBA35]|nr:Ubiquitin carboxyl-terminal hydrolase 35 [Mortierella sp. GBA35]
METVIRKVLAAAHLPDTDKRKAVLILLAKTKTLPKPDASPLLDLGLELKTAPHRTLLEDQIGDRILEAVSIAHRDLYWAFFRTDWFQSKISGTVTEKQTLMIDDRLIPLIATALIEDDKLEVEMDMTALQTFAEKKCINAQPPLDYSIQGVFIAMFVNLPATRPLAVSDYIQFLVDHIASSPVISGPGQEASLQSTKNAALLLRQCWEDRPDNVVLTLPHLLFYLSDTQKECPLALGYLVGTVPPNFTSYVEPFIQGMDSSALWRLELPIQRLIDWLVTTDMPGIGVWIVALMEGLASQGQFLLLRGLADKNAYKIARQLAFKQRRSDALPVLRFILLGYHHSDVLFKNISQGLIPLVIPCRNTPPIVPRTEALRTMQETSWKKSFHIQIPPAKAITTRLRETFTGMSTSRLSIFTPLTLYKALPDWLNDGHQQDAAEFTKILFSLMEDEDPASKQALSSFHESPLDLQSMVDIFPSVEELNEENNNMYRCDKCQELRAASRFTMLASLPTNLIVSLNRFRFDVQRSRRIKINTPIRLAESVQVRAQDGHDRQGYELYAVVVHTGESANHGHYYTYAKDSGPSPTTVDSASSSTTSEAVKSTWLLYNDTSVTVSSFETMQQTLANSRADTPYMLFFRKTELQSSRVHAPIARTTSNL